jgi:hypothetical protein
VQATEVRKRPLGHAEQRAQRTPRRNLGGSSDEHERHRGQLRGAWEEAGCAGKEGRGPQQRPRQASKGRSLILPSVRLVEVCLAAALFLLVLPACQFKLVQLWPSIYSTYVNQSVKTRNFVKGDIP